jgi:hypothetical protein
MKDHAAELEGVRLDIETLRTMIDLARDKGVGSEDMMLRACAEVLYERRKRLDELGRITLYVSRRGCDPRSGRREDA